MGYSCLNMLQCVAVYGQVLWGRITHIHTHTYTHTHTHTYTKVTHTHTHIHQHTFTRAVLMNPKYIYRSAWKRREFCCKRWWALELPPSGLLHCWCVFPQKKTNYFWGMFLELVRCFFLFFGIILTWHKWHMIRHMMHFVGMFVPLKFLPSALLVVLYVFFGSRLR